MSAAAAGRRGIALLGILAAALAFWIQQVHLDPPRHNQRENADLRRLYFPNAVYLHEELRAGRIPLWNPYQLAGAPFLAKHQPGALYPPNLLLLAALPPARALEVHAVLHLFLAGAFTWLFLGRLGLGAAARLAGAAAFMFADPLEREIYLVNLLSTSAWLPAVLWALHGLIEERRVRWAVALAGAASLSFLGGYAQGFVYTLQFAAAYGLFGLLLVPRGERASVLGLAGLAGVLTLGLCAAQLLPALELVRHGGLGLPTLGLEEATAGRFALAPRQLGLGLLGGGRWGPGPGFPLVALVTAPLVALGWWDRNRRAQWGFFAAAAALAAAFMLGDRTPLYALYHALPLGDAFRIPLRMVLVLALCVSVLTALGVQAVGQLAARRPTRPRVARALPWIAAALVALDSYAKNEVRFAHPASHPAAFRPKPDFAPRLAERAGLDRTFLEESGKGFFPKRGTLERLYLVPDYDGMVPRVYQAYFAAHTLWHGAVQGAYLPPAALRRFVRLLDGMSVRHYVLNPALDPAAVARFERAIGRRARRVGETLWIERPEALPRAYAVLATRVLEGDSPHDFHRAVFGGGGAFALVAPGGPRLAPADPSARAAASIASYGANAVEIDASCGAPCLVVLTDLHYPGWRASVDGVPASVHRVNFLFRGVQVPPGRHRVAFRYAPRSVYTGGGLSVLAVAAAVVLVLRGAGGRRAEARP